MISLLSKIQSKIAFLYRRYIKKDPFTIEVARWFSDKGDKTLRLNYPLTKDSVVFDIGGYQGDFAADIHNRYECTVYLFEPVTEFFEYCLARFENNRKIVCLNFGLSSVDGWFDIGLSDNGSSFDSPYAKDAKQHAQVRSVVFYIREIGLDRIDLLKINIEGGEYDVIPAIIQSGIIKNINYLQIQFHNFVDNADEKRKVIREQLAQTHTEMWNYNFIWESWELKEPQISA